MKPFTITIASPAALELFQQFAESMPSDGEKWAESMRRDCEKLSVKHDRLAAVTVHRHTIARLARKTAAGLELGVDVTLDDNEGFMPDYLEASNSIAEELASASMRDGKDAIMRMLGISEEEYDEFVEIALNDPNCPDVLRTMIGKTSTEGSGDIVSTTLDELSKEGKNVVKFPTGRKDN